MLYLQMLRVYPVYTCVYRGVYLRVHAYIVGLFAERHCTCTGCYKVVATWYCCTMYMYMYIVQWYMYQVAHVQTSTTKIQCTCTCILYVQLYVTYFVSCSGITVVIMGVAPACVNPI